MDEQAKALMFKLALTIHAVTMSYLATAGLAPELSWVFQVGASCMFGIAVFAIAHALHIMSHKRDKIC